MVKVNRWVMRYGVALVLTTQISAMRQQQSMLFRAPVSADHAQSTDVYEAMCRFDVQAVESMLAARAFDINAPTCANRTLLESLLGGGISCVDSVQLSEDENRQMQLLLPEAQEQFKKAIALLRVIAMARVLINAGARVVSGEEERINLLSSVLALQVDRVSPDPELIRVPDVALDARVRASRTELLQLLLENNASVLVNKPDDQGCPPLLRVCIEHQDGYADTASVVQLLLEHRASVEHAQVATGKTALHFVVGYADAARTTLLLEAGASVLAQDYARDTALTMIDKRVSQKNEHVDVGAVTIVQQLIMAGADEQAKDANGRRILEKLTSEQAPQTMRDGVTEALSIKRQLYELVGALGYPEAMPAGSLVWSEELRTHPLVVSELKRRAALHAYCPEEAAALMTRENTRIEEEERAAQERHDREQEEREREALIPGAGQLVVARAAYMRDGYWGLPCACL